MPFANILAIVMFIAAFLSWVIGVMVLVDAPSIFHETAGMLAIINGSLDSAAAAIIVTLCAADKRAERRAERMESLYDEE